MKRFIAFTLILAVVGSQLEDMGSKSINASHNRIAQVEQSIKQD